MHTPQWRFGLWWSHAVSINVIRRARLVVGWVTIRRQGTISVYNLLSSVILCGWRGEYQRKFDSKQIQHVKQRPRICGLLYVCLRMVTVW